MKRTLLVLAAMSLATFASLASAASVSVTVLPSVAPNFFGSPSWSGYVTNAIQGLENGQTTVGDRNTNPTGYQVTSSVLPGQLLATGYNSWDGVANPAAPFNNELGNRLHFGLVVIATGVQFTLSDVSFALSSDDTSGSPGGYLAYDDNLAGTDFSSGTRIGINYGADGKLGGGDDTVYDMSNIGDDSVLLNALYYVGAGNAFAEYDPTQEASDDSWIQQNVSSVSAIYTVDIGGADYSGSATATVVPTPSAALGATALLGGLGLIGALKRLRQQIA